MKDRSLVGKRKIHFIGIGGNGMSALAEIALAKGFDVQGSDSALNEKCTKLSQMGAHIYQGIDDKSLEGSSAIVYSSAITSDHPERKKANELGIPIYHRSQLLRFFFQDKTTIVVSGSHGKTTTSALVAYLLQSSGEDVSFALGGHLLPEKKNAHFGNSSFFVLEGDESDGSFLCCQPKYAIITSVDEDHLSVWKTKESLFAAFAAFFQKTESPIWYYDDEIIRTFAKKGISVGFQKEADFYITSIKTKQDRSIFSFRYEGTDYVDWQLPMIGKYNVLNTCFALALAFLLKLDTEILYEKLKKFPGIARRMEKIYDDEITLFDDYAHHPTEVKAALQALKQAYYPRRIVALFQPHRISRFNALEEGFKEALQDADAVCVDELYFADEAKTKETKVKAFAQTINAHYLNQTEWGKQVCEHLRTGDVVISLGAGDITNKIRQIPSNLSHIKPIKMVLLFGGSSQEHQISIKTAKAIYHSLDPDLYKVTLLAIDRSGKWMQTKEFPEKISGEPFKSEHLKELKEADLVFPIFHGEWGEDGNIQGFLDTLGIPYVGTDYRSSAIAMQKCWVKCVAKEIGIKVAPFLQVTREDNIDNFLKKCREKLQLPVWVKPVHMGSSIGVSRVEKWEQLVEKMNEALSLDNAAIVEEEVIGRQLEFAVMGKDKAQVSWPGEILNNGLFYDFEKKYESSMEVSSKARIPKEYAYKGQKLALQVYRALQCSGLSRVDFFLTEQGEFIFNEINPFPGFTKISLFPKVWEEEGISLQQLVSHLIALTLRESKFAQKI
jgi:UDP-N-acetylmuramate--alanine ligase